MKDVRILYRRIGRIKYISHLDMNRLMQRALKRSGLPVWYTQGFNPHLYLTFARPLSLGFESDYEVLDIRLESDVPQEQIVSALNAQLPEGLMVYLAAAPEHDSKEIAFCDYLVVLEAEKMGGAAAKAALEQLLSHGELLVEKRSKKGIKTVDIRPLVSLLKAECEGDKLLFTLRCASGSEQNVNPALVVGALCEGRPLDAADADYRRLSVLRSDLTPFR